MSEWVVFIYNPRTKRTRRRYLSDAAWDQSMGWAPTVVYEASKRFGAPSDRILAIPNRQKSRTRHRRSR